MHDYPNARRSARARTWLAVVTLTALSLAAACGDTTLAPLQLEGRPNELEFSLGGFAAPSKILQLRGDTVVVRRIPSSFLPGMTIDTLRVVPSLQAWRAFWNAADNAGIQNWNATYDAEGVVDGSGWALRVVSTSRQVQSTGSNAYPDRIGRKSELNETAEFRALLTGLNALVGQTWF